MNQIPRSLTKASVGQTQVGPVTARAGSLALWLVVVLAAGLFATSLAADEHDLHAEGVKALAAKDWSRAEGHFRDAIAEESDEKAGVFFGKTYVPHYLLGVALVEQDRCRPALDALRESKRQGKVQKTDYGDEIDARIAACESRLREIERVRLEAEQALERARRGAESVADLAGLRELRAVWSQGDPSLAARQGRAESQITEADRLLRDGAEELDEAKLQRAASTASDATAMLVTVEEEGKVRLGQINAASAEAVAALGEAKDAARRLLTAVAPLAPYPPRLGGQVQALKNLLTDIEKELDGARPQELERATDEIIRETRVLRGLAGSPPRALSTAAEAFLSGDAERALMLLAEAELSGDRSRWHARVLQAAARYHLFLLGGEENDALYDAAVADVEAAVALGDGHGTLSETHHSPRFLEFFRGTRVALENAATDADER
ncbi:MAG: hypothetical protein AAGC60_24120 [Acidobacteriota bacterium]